MESEVLNFLTRLATEPETLSAFLRDPEVVMKEQALDEQARGALTSGDPLRVHRAINASSAADAESAEQSVAKARQVADILASDPAVAQWIQNHYWQQWLTWMGRVGGAAPSTALAPVGGHMAVQGAAAAPDA